MSSRWRKDKAGRIRLVRGCCRVCGCKGNLEIIESISLCFLCSESFDAFSNKEKNKILVMERWLALSFRRIGNEDWCEKQQTKNDDRALNDKVVIRKIKEWDRHLRSAFGSIKVHEIYGHDYDPQVVLARKELSRLLSIHRQAKACGKREDATEAIRAFRKLRKSLNRASPRPMG